MSHRALHQRANSNERRSHEPVAALKARQSARIRDIARALASTGIVELDRQARALGLSRSTAWTILSASHKSTGISPAVIDRMLASPRLPGEVRTEILVYVGEKAA